MKSESMGSVSIIQHQSQDRTPCPSLSLERLGMVKHWTLLHSRMQSSISSHLLTRVVLSYTCHQEHGWLKVSILLVIWHCSWKKVLSFLDLRYFTFFSFFYRLLIIVLFTEDSTCEIFLSGVTLCDKWFSLFLFFFSNAIDVLAGSISLGSCWSITFLWSRSWSSRGKISEFNKWIHVRWCGDNRFFPLPASFLFPLSNRFS